MADVVNSFPDGYRIPFTMHVAGYKYAEIAERMHLPLGTVKSRIFYARKFLRGTSGRLQMTERINAGQRNLPARRSNLELNCSSSAS